MAVKKQKLIFPTEKVMKRFRILMWLALAVALIIMGRAAYIMLVERDYWMTVSKKYESRFMPLEAPRGNILAADGQVLATSLPEYRIYLDPMSWEPDKKRRKKDQAFRDSILYACIDSIVDGMHRIIPELDPAATKKRILEGRKKESHSISLHRRRISYIQLTELRKLPLFRLPPARSGLNAEEFRRRKRPYGALASRTIGTLRSENDSALSGLELAFDSVLSGKPGVFHYKRVNGRKVKDIDTLAVEGGDVVTTLDVAMQDVVEETLRKQLEKIGAKAGMCILMEVPTGDVKAISSMSLLQGGGYAEISPRAVTNMMEPGSVFKPMSFMVAMDDGKITMNSTCDTGCGVREMYGRKMRDSNWRKGGDGVLSVPEIIKKSSNVGVSSLIDNAYAANPDQFVDGLYRIGVAEDLHLPIPGYQKPKIRYRRDNPDGWYRTTLPWMSIGYETQLPPISTLTFYNGVANGGKLVRPRFVTAIRRGDKVVQEFPVTVLREKMCKPETLRNIQICLEGVVGKNSGTGKAAYSKYFKVAGKTGTAQIWGKGGFSSNYLVSFAGYFPADAPRYSMIVCIEKGGLAYGGLHCGPVFKTVAETVMARELNTTYTTAIDSTTLRTALPYMHAGNLDALNHVLESFNFPSNSDFPRREGIAWGSNAGGFHAVSLTVEPKSQGMPNLKGYGLRDAVYRLERMGLKVRARGIGRVLRQSIAPGTKVRSGQRVELILGRDEKELKQLHLPSSPSDSVRRDSTQQSSIKKAEPSVKLSQTSSPKAEKTASIEEKKTSKTKKTEKP